MSDNKREVTALCLKANIIDSSKTLHTTDALKALGANEEKLFPVYADLDPGGDTVQVGKAKTFYMENAEQGDGLYCQITFDIESEALMQRRPMPLYNHAKARQDDGHSIVTYAEMRSIRLVFKHSQDEVLPLSTWLLDPSPPLPEKVQSEWTEFWQEIIAPDGEISLSQLKRELADFSTLIENASLVYDHATGGRVSKPMTDPEAVKAAIDDNYKEVYTQPVKPIAADKPMRCFLIADYPRPGAITLCGDITENGYILERGILDTLSKILQDLTDKTVVRLHIQRRDLTLSEQQVLLRSNSEGIKPNQKS